MNADKLFYHFVHLLSLVFGKKRKPQRVHVRNNDEANERMFYL